MKTPKPFLMAFLFVYTVAKLSAQQAEQSSSDPFKYAYDRYGKRYDLRDLMVESPRIGPLGPEDKSSGGTGPGKSYSGNQTNAFPLPTLTCSAGYFNLYFDAPSLFGMSSQARSVACQVYSDLSSFIIAPAPMSIMPGVGPKINIFCTMSVGPALAIGTPFMVYPYNPTNPNQGFLDGQVYKQLTTGVDPYLNIPISFANSGNFYHGAIAASSNLLFPYTFNFTPSGTMGWNQYDFYSVLLHEAMHSLGFLSNMSATGLSNFGAANNYYTRYDKFLTNAAGTPLLANTVDPGCPNSNLTYVGLPTDLVPGGTCVTDVTSCMTAVRFVSPGVDEKVYTPSCWEAGSSMSHFEDMCNGHTGPGGLCPTTGNNYYFAMANAIPPGQCAVRRYIKEEERLALCDMGYNCNFFYMSASGVDIDGGFNYHVYSTSCTPPLVQGLNDGIAGNTYVYNTTGSSINIPSTVILGNDIGSNLSMSCIEVIYTNGFNNATASMVGSNLSVNATAGSGLVVVKYYPYDGVNMGNATYVFVQFNSSNCSSVANCNLIQNGGFENITGTPSCGELGVHLPATALNCWAPAEGSPALFTRFCATNTTYELGVNTLGSAPAVVNSFNGSPNNSAIGLNYASGSSNTEAIKNYLSGPLVPGLTYNLSFMALNASAAAPYNTANVPVVITVAALPLFNTAISFPYPSGLTVINQFVIPAGTSWSQINYSFVFSPSNNTNHQALVIGIDPAGTMAQGGSPPMQMYCYIDEVSLIQDNGVTFTTGNPTICGNQPIIDLSVFANYPGTFSGNYVTYNNNVYSFNDGTILPPGQYPISYNYTLNGCSNTMYQFITVSSNTNILSLTPGICAPNGTLNLTSLITNPAYVAGTSFSVNGVAASSPYTFPSQGSYTVTAQNGAGSLCSNVPATVVVMSYSIPAAPWTIIGPAIASSTSICLGDPYMPVNAISTTGATYYEWLPEYPTGIFTVTTIYTVTAYNGLYCQSLPSTVAVNVLTNCCTSTLTPYTQPTLTGPLNAARYFPNDVTIPPGFTVAISSAEYVFGPNVRLIVSNNAMLRLRGTHLYSCGPQMWGGIEVQGSGQVQTFPADNLIEDAKVAINVISPSNPTLVLSLQNVTFNKNHIDIQINGYATAQPNYPFSIQNCVFTCRDLPFTSTSWPNTSTLPGGLREATGSGGLSSPYLLQGYPIGTLKLPYTGEQSSSAIVLSGVGQTTGMTFYNILIGDAANQPRFNLFDAHGNFIDANRANLTCVNAVFQNTQRYYSTVSGTTEGGTAISHTAPGIINSFLNLDAGSGPGNYFYDCHKSVVANNIYRFRLKNAVFASNQVFSTLPPFLPGNTGIELRSNRHDYIITNNIFNNIRDCIKIPAISGLYNVGTGLQTGVYVLNLLIQENYFGPQTSSFISPLTGQYINQAIDLSGPNSATWSNPLNPVRIISNRMDRCFRGIRVTGLGSYPCRVEGNDILMEDEPFINLQNGIEAYNTINNLSVRYNTLASPGKQNNNLSLVYMDNTAKAVITCNDLNSSYNAFVFNGSNLTTTWMGNTMKNHARGLVLQNSAVIGPQGGPSNRSDNKWLGTWALPDYETYVIASNAASSPLYVGIGAPTEPFNNGGAPPAWSYGAAGNILYATNVFQCPASGLPVPPQYRSGELTSILNVDQKFSAVSVFPNPTSGKLHISGNLEAETFHIIVTDLSGKHLYEKQITTEHYQSEIFLELETGVYLIQLVNPDSGERTVRKLIVEK